MSTADDVRMRILRDNFAKGISTTQGMSVIGNELVIQLLVPSKLPFKQILKATPDEALPWMLKELEAEIKSRGRGKGLSG